MKIADKRCPFVILGTWNMAIFTPPFVSKVIMSGVSVDQTVAPITGGLVFEYKGPHFTFAVQHERVAFRPNAISIDDLRAVEVGAQALLNELPHTPVTAAGINFGFDEEASASRQLQALFSFSDDGRLSELGISVDRRILRNQFSRDADGGALTVILTKSPIQNTVSIDVNYQRAAEIARHVAEMPKAILARKEAAVQFLAAVYGLEVGA